MKLVIGWVFLRRLKVLVYNVNCLGFCNGNSYMYFVYDIVFFLWMFLFLIYGFIDNLFLLNV